MYTLTLLSVFLGPFALMFTWAKHHVDELKIAAKKADPPVDEPELRDWLQKHGFGTSVGDTLKNTLLVLAPLLVGPLGDIAKGFG